MNIALRLQMKAGCFVFLNSALVYSYLAGIYLGVLVEHIRQYQSVGVKLETKHKLDGYLIPGQFTAGYILNLIWHISC